MGTEGGDGEAAGAAEVAPAARPAGLDAEDVHHGVKLAHDLARVALARAERAEARLEALVAALEARGVVADGEVPASPPELAGSPLQEYQPAIFVSAAAAPDKHTVPSPDIDCQALLHLCHGRCCRYKVQLSYQDVEDGLRFVYQRPYELRREADGYCTYFDRASPGCGTYATRPAPCRTFDCRDNPNVWIDYEQRIPVPMAPPLFQIRRK